MHALGIIEVKSIARGLKVTDMIAKKAPVTILRTHPICPGKYMVIFGGEVGDVEESLKEGQSIASDMLVSDLFLPHIHESILPAISGTTKIEKFGALGIIETFSVASCVRAADKAAKMTPI